MDPLVNFATDVVSSNEKLREQKKSLEHQYTLNLMDPPWPIEKS